MAAQDFTEAELQEFLEADGLDVRPDPVFKERLRRMLWDIVRRRAGGDSDGSGEGGP